MECKYEIGKKPLKTSYKPKPSAAQRSKISFYLQKKALNSILPFSKLNIFCSLLSIFCCLPRMDFFDEVKRIFLTEFYFRKNIGIFASVRSCAHFGFSMLKNLMWAMINSAQRMKKQWNGSRTQQDKNQFCSPCLSRQKHSTYDFLSMLFHAS